MSASAGFQNNLLGNISINLTPSKINYNPENSEKFVTGAYVPPPKKHQNQNGRYSNTSWEEKKNEEQNMDTTFNSKYIVLF